MRLLLVDDLPMNQRMMLGLLKNTGMQVDIARSGAECIRLLQEKEYAIILMDNMTSDMDGFQMMKEMMSMELPLNSNTPVILQTSDSGEEIEKSCRQAGFAGYLEKPVEPEQLMAVLRKYVSFEQLMLPPEELTRQARQMQELAAEILVAESDHKVSQQIAIALEHYYKVHFENSCERVMRHMKNHMPDLLLIDQKILETGDESCLSQLREKVQTESVPMILLSRDLDQKQLAKHLKEGVTDYIQLPLCDEMLQLRVNRALIQESRVQDLKQDVDQRTHEVIEKNKMLKRLMMQIVEALAGTIDAKDKYTNGHSKRVALYSRELAQLLGKSSEEQNEIYCAGLLHDIGKIGVPGRIITKASSLDDREYSIVKEHPVIGAEILESISEMPNLCVGARWHHECFDGSGYPDGLSGEQIPQMARIIAVADAYDAMTSKRSYRDVLPQAVVRKEIENGRGTQFDPVVVDAMLTVIDEDTNYEKREH